MIGDGGDNVVNRSQGLMRLNCHQPAAKHIFERVRVCSSIQDQQIAEL
jgi:hypothetical protein